MENISFPISLATGFALGLVTALFTRRRGRVKYSSPSKVSSLKSSHIKQVLVVRTDLGMSKGKIAAQCSHAALGCYKRALERFPTILELWEKNGEPKVILRLEEKGEEPLSELTRKAERAGLVACMIHDAGRTQVARMSATVVAIGPGPAETIDPLVEHLKPL